MAKQCLPCTGGNNSEPTCPILHDYRPFTDYAPRCAQVYQQTQKNEFASSYDMREWLITNATGMIKQNAEDAYVKMQCQCVSPWDQGTMLPELQKQTCTDRICKFDINNKYGLGLGRVYYDPDTEKQFRSKFVGEKEKEQSFFRENGCCGVANDSQYWPIDGTPLTPYDRYSIPSGGIPLTQGDSMHANYMQKN
jgi:hypothetical protein